MHPFNGNVLRARFKSFVVFFSVTNVKRSAPRHMRCMYKTSAPDQSHSLNVILVFASFSLLLMHLWEDCANDLWRNRFNNSMLIEVYYAFCWTYRFIGQFCLETNIM